jgi:hypothetical protein
MVDWGALVSAPLKSLVEELMRTGLFMINPISAFKCFDCLPN